MRSTVVDFLYNPLLGDSNSKCEVMHQLTCVPFNTGDKIYIQNITMKRDRRMLRPSKKSKCWKILLNIEIYHQLSPGNFYPRETKEKQRSATQPPD